MTFTLKIRDILYLSVIGILVIALSVSFAVYKVGAAETKMDSTAAAELSPEKSFSDLPFFGQENVNVVGIDHLSCQAQIAYTTTSSTTYNPNFPFNNTFMLGGSSTQGQQFQDINGDGLPDYLYNIHYLSGAGNELESLFYGCAYLNNGSGWDKAYICYARTRTNINTGQVISSEYRGDCAGQE
ncbi:MAG TPA: hypothetical protein PKD79_01555 [Candidatus Doudnabacteria bacterium]|nr:hypothetical protein [Candidatus Doudnabacteria bacterium]